MQARQRIVSPIDGSILAVITRHGRRGAVHRGLILRTSRLLMLFLIAAVIGSVSGQVLPSRQVPDSPTEAQPTKALAACEALASLKLSNGVISLSRLMLTPTQSFCRVAATLCPSPDSDIKIELWLPTAHWNGKFQAVGNGAFTGAINYAAMTAALDRGYATASTDTGHAGDGARWSQGHPEKVIDFGWRAIHEMTVFPSRLSQPTTTLDHASPTGMAALQADARA
jgi:hypothetical protein